MTDIEELINETTEDTSEDKSKKEEDFMNIKIVKEDGSTSALVRIH